MCLKTVIIFSRYHDCIKANWMSEGSFCTKCDNFTYMKMNKGENAVNSKASCRSV